jgi:hypothetical protein
VIAESPSAGAVQVIKTLLPEIVVVGATGVLGFVAGRTAPFPESETVDVPKAFSAST